MKQYYKILGISQTASETEIKKAYRKGAMFWHPDKNKSANAKERFIEIQEAYEVLIDIEKRKVYDSLLNREKSKNHQEQPFREETKKQDFNNSKTKEKANRNFGDYQKFEDWIREIRKKAEKKANMPFVDDMLTESFHFLDKYGIWLIIAFVLITLLFAMNL